VSGGTTSVIATNTFGINGLVSRNDSAGTNFYAFDPQGSTAERVDSSGTLVSSDCYNAWGTIATTASAAVVFGYIAQWGYYTDAETGLVLCTHRYYDPAHGRWLTRDPIGYAGGVGLYGYCQDEPVVWLDFYGTDSTGVIAGGIIGGIFTGIVAIVLFGSGVGEVVVAVGGTSYVVGDVIVSVASGAAGAAMGNGAEASNSGECVTKAMGSGAIWGGLTGLLGGAPGNPVVKGILTGVKAGG